jgi:hypothetical protein
MLFRSGFAVIGGVVLNSTVNLSGLLENARFAISTALNIIESRITKPAAIRFS